MANPLVRIYRLSVICMINFNKWKSILCKPSIIREINGRLFNIVLQ